MTLHFRLLLMLLMQHGSRSLIILGGGGRTQIRHLLIALLILLLLLLRCPGSSSYDGGRSQRIIATYQSRRARSTRCRGHHPTTTAILHGLPVIGRLENATHSSSNASLMLAHHSLTCRGTRGRRPRRTERCRSLTHDTTKRIASSSCSSSRSVLMRLRSRGSRGRQPSRAPGSIR